MLRLWIVGILVFEYFKTGNFQYFDLQNQNASYIPYPYQNTLGLSPPPPLEEVSNAHRSYSLSSGYNQLSPYYAQSGWPRYPGMGYPFPVYPQPYNFPGPPPNGYPMGFGPPGMGYSQPPKPVGQPDFGPNSNIKTEILDVSPDYQRQVLGWTEDNLSGSKCVGSQCQEGASNRPRYTITYDTQTTNITRIPTNLTKPIITEKQFVTSIKRTFVYDSTKPENITPINIHIINGQQVTSTPPPETTANEDVQGITSWYDDNKV